MKTCKHPGGCDRPTKGRGWCKAHLDRVRRTGNPGPAAIESRKPLGRACAIKDCNGVVDNMGGNDYCGTHYQRLRKHGDPLMTLTGGASLPGPSNPNWSGDSASYSAVHVRIKGQRGPARQFQCIDCGSVAREWSYDNADPNEQRDPLMGRYSTDLSHYDPRCTSCHRKFDNAARALLTGERP